MNSKLKKALYAAGTFVLILGAIFVFKKYQKPIEIPGIVDEPVEEKILKEPFTELIPAYGIVLHSGKELELEVAVDSNDARNVKPGQSVIISSNRITSTRGKVTRILHGANAETGQSVAWLSSANTDGRDHSGEFVWTKIELRSGESVLVAPTKSILIKEGKTWVINGEHKPIEVTIGKSNSEKTEILTGVKEEDTVVTEGGIGFLFPDFKASGE